MLGLRLGARRLVWGGSAAIRGAAFPALDLPAALQHALADDLHVSEAARRAGLRVLVRRAVLVPVPAEGPAAPGQLRHLRMLRLFRPGTWACLAALMLAEAAALPLLLLALAGAAPAYAWPVLAILTAMGAARAVMHDLVGRRLGVPDRGMARAMQVLLGLVRPLAVGLTLPLLLQSGVGRRIRWRHLDYRVGRDGHPMVIRRGSFG